ncbi:MAG: histidine phosphatase family protein [Eubacteriales bacterium]|nr:histidine phosphatase family protein [Eubacteriales bacterium]
MREIVLIRHGATAGNLEKRYIGSATDEPLCSEGIEVVRSLIKRGRYPEAAEDALVITSPLRRCVETAGLIYPGVERTEAENLRECDFGRFEYKNYEELDGDSDYQAWIVSGGTLPFPGGEDPEEFKARSRNAFMDAVRDNRERSQLIFVVHGGTVMSVMSSFAKPHREYFDSCVSNGRGFICDIAGDGTLYVNGEI